MSILVPAGTPLLVWAHEAPGPSQLPENSSARLSARTCNSIIGSSLCDRIWNERSRRHLQTLFNRSRRLSVGRATRPGIGDAAGARAAVLTRNGRLHGALTRTGVLRGVDVIGRRRRR